MVQRLATPLYARTIHGLFCAASLLTSAGCLPPPSSGLQSWLESGTRAIMPGDPPLPENEIYSAAAASARLVSGVNETVSLQVALRTDSPPVAPLDVRVSTFRSVDGAALRSDSVRLFRVYTTRVERYASWFPEHADQPALPADYPDALVPWDAARGAGPIRLDDIATRAVWIDIRVPPTTTPGEYTARLDILDASARRVLRTTTLRLLVLPVAIPASRSIPFYCRIDPRDLLAAHLNWPESQAEQVRIIPDEPSHQAAQRLVDATMRLFESHRTAPILWANFPTYRLTGARSVEIDWHGYDALASSWLSGEAFDDRVPLPGWVLPVSLEHPSAEINGGFDSPRYARLLGAYLAACRKHFEQRGWAKRSVLRIQSPTKLDERSVRAIERLSGIIGQSETRIPLAAHLPPRSLRALGWRGAPQIDLPGVDIWIPPASWLEPDAMRRATALDRRVWFMPDQPPYSPSLAAEAPVVDGRALGWQAYRYGVDGVWIEHAADRRDAAPGDAAPLVYPGHAFGISDAPVPTLRLKRLRRGLLDYELLKLLEHNGKGLLADRTARQIVRWAFTDACAENLLSVRRTGWVRDPAVYELAHRVLLQELANTFAPSSAGSDRQARNLADWAVIMNSSAQIVPEVRGVRLSAEAGGTRAHVFASVSNAADQPLRGAWRAVGLPDWWRALPTTETVVTAGGRSVQQLQYDMNITFNRDGVFPFQLQFDTRERGAFTTSARLAVAACPPVDAPPTINGDLSDWPAFGSNVAGDFRLCRGRRTDVSAVGTDRPTLGTRAMFCRDRERLYVSIRCALAQGEAPIWSTDNRVPIERNGPWGQDVVEILLTPHATIEGTGADLFVLQIKPSGLLVARRGARSDPPMNASETWNCNADVAVKITQREWIVEAAIPLAALGEAPLDNPIWGCNVTRVDARRGEYSSWSAARGQCYAPQLLGNLLVSR